MPVSLVVTNQEEFTDDSVGYFQRQALCQKYELLEGMNPMALDSSQLKQLFICAHAHKKHYAKNMCHNCYHNKGKQKKATACIHTSKPHYSNGLCQNCYLAQYYLKRKKKNLLKKLGKTDSVTNVSVNIDPTHPRQTHEESNQEKDKKAEFIFDEYKIV